MSVRMKKTRVRNITLALFLTLVLVLGAGVEPARANAHRILSPACLPIPPSEHPVCEQKRSTSAPILFGARDGIRTRDPDLGKVVLYQLSYSRLCCSALHRFATGDKCKKYF